MELSAPESTWNHWRLDNHAKFFNHEPPWKINKPQVDTGIPLPTPGMLNAYTLGKDVWLMILECLPASTLTKTMALASHGFHDLCMSIIFRHVDINLHHYRIRDEYLSLQYPSGHWQPEQVGRKHCRFVRQLLKTPEYGVHARSFTWTMDVVSLVRRNVSLADEWQQASNQLRMFELMQNVTSVDIDAGCSHCLPVLAHSTSLFPKATDIRLGGVMHWSIASAILHGEDKAPLKSLVLYSLIEGGHFYDGSPFSHGIYRHRQNLPNTHAEDIEEDWQEGEHIAPIQVRPGCMRRILTPGLARRCRSLDRLLLRKQGQQHWQQELPSQITYDEDVYHEWASFIARVKPRYLRLEHGGSTLYPWNGGRDASCRSVIPIPKITKQAIAPMDEHFRDIIAPLLMEGWSRLRFLEMSGISSEVATPIALALLSNQPDVIVLADPRLEWCWNGNVSPRTSSGRVDRFRRPPLHSENNLVSLVRGPDCRAKAGCFLNWMNDNVRVEFFREEEQKARFAVEEGFVSEEEASRKVADFKWSKLEWIARESGRHAHKYEGQPEIYGRTFY
ncbi:hypothetical protein BDV95DRAFT_605106 [Massariosphaeria phaeospora]|uniref:Uncharacterized protein n=1 Tax=Massariosphaeria phaeospora TaxID=100035 RepID=A0A7C8I8X0_9PLEO|nr:hypothetical protein BDV95DRAFT_605106 [Massariosphaeria phaeospora]